MEIGGSDGDLDFVIAQPLLFRSCIPVCCSLSSSSPQSFLHVSLDSVAPMASQKYSVLDHDAPEVVPKNDAPEVYQESPIYRPRTTSVDSPQVVENAYHHKASVNGSYGAADAAPASQSTGEAGILSEKGHENKNGRRYCGMRRPIFIAVIVIALLVVIGVVLGAVLGTVLSNKRWD